MTFLPRTLAVLIVLSLLAGPALSGFTDRPRTRHAPDEILVTCREGVDESRCRAAVDAAGLTELRGFRFASDPQSKLNRVHLVRIPPGQGLDDALEAALRLPEVEAAQPNYIYRALQVPDDPYYYLQWGQDNQGGNPPYDNWGLPGPDPFLPDADMDVPEATSHYEGWTFEPVIVGVIDTGMDLDHSDLAPHLWINVDEVPGDGADNDSNGYVDDVYGWDFANGDNDPTDLDGHGTHVAGVIGAITDNGVGVAGIAPNAVLMPVRFLDDTGTGYTDDAIDAIAYAAGNGALVINASWGSVDHDPLLQDAVEAAGAAGVLFVASAGNEASDNDEIHHYPSGYDSENIISVAASSPWGGLADFSNWGIESVDIAAPGDEIISTTPPVGDPGIPDDQCRIADDAGYPGLIPWSGTSMATPAVSGAVVVLFGAGEELWPDWSAMTPVEQMLAVRDRILNRTEHWPSFNGQTVTDGHLNLYNLIEDDIHPPDPVGPSFELAARGTDFVVLRCTATGDDGATGQANYYDLRYQPGDTIDFAAATRLRDVWAPGPPGSTETYTLAGLSPASDYTFGLVVVDNVGNQSPVTELTVTTLPPVVQPPVAVLFEDHFDGNDCGNWTMEGSWGCEAESLSDSPGSVYPVNNRASATLAPLSFEGARAVQVAFDLVSMDYEPDYDYLYFQYSLDGTSWRSLDRYTGSAGGPQAYDLPALAGHPAVWFRLVSSTDYNFAFQGARMDDFWVGYRAAPAGCSGDPECDDMNVCTVDSCDDVTGHCYNTPIPGCEDTDADGVEDPVDNCPATPNGPYGGTCVSVVVGAPCAGADDCFDGETYGICSLAQEDLDGDEQGDACDPDQDGDGVDAAAGDCDDRQALVYPGAEEVCDGLDNDCDGGIDNVPPPPATATLSVSPETLTWTAVDGATMYDVVRGDLIVLAESGLEGATTDCFAENLSSTEIGLGIPAPGEGRWYLVRAVNCGGAGSYGSGNPPQSPTRDEGIALSGNDCELLP